MKKLLLLLLLLSLSACQSRTAYSEPESSLQQQSAAPQEQERQASEELPSPELHHMPTAHTSAISSMAFLKEDLLLSGDKDGEVIGWDLNEEKIAFQLSPKESYHPVLRLAAHPDQTRFLMVRDEEDLTGYIDTEGEALPPFESPITCKDVFISPDGSRFAATTYWRPVPLYNAETGTLEVIHSFPDELRQNLEKATAVAFSPSGERMATARWDEAIRVFFTEHSLTGESELDGFLDVAWSPDGTLLAGGVGVLNKGEKSVQLQIFFAGSGLKSVEIADAPPAVLFTPDSSQVAGLRGDQLHLWSVEDGSRVVTYGDETKGVTSFALSPAGERIALGYQDGSVEVLSIER